MTATKHKKVLVLNKNWSAINIVPVFDAIIKVFNERALFLHPETYQTFDFEGWVTNWDEAIRTAQVASHSVIPLQNFSFVLPEVILLSQYRGFGSVVDLTHIPKFNRRNLVLRDKGICQYCGKKFDSELLTQDHVIPKSQGGQANWKNIVLSCVNCNHKKRNRTPQEAHMSLIRTPFVPTNKDVCMSHMDRLKLKIKNKPPKTWEQFLGKMYWDVELS